MAFLEGGNAKFCNSLSSCVMLPPHLLCHSWHRKQSLHAVNGSGGKGGSCVIQELWLLQNLAFPPSRNTLGLKVR